MPVRKARVLLLPPVVVRIDVAELDDTLGPHHEYRGHRKQMVRLSGRRFQINTKALAVVFMIPSFSNVA